MKEQTDYIYAARPSAVPLDISNAWNHPAWNQAQTIRVAQFREESSNHRPTTQARLMYSPAGLHGIFQVQDQFVRAARCGYQSEVWKDSCVEIFIQPKPELGYFNFEMNCGASLLCTYITDPTRMPGGALKQCVKIPEALGRTIQVRSTLPSIVDPEIPEPTTWELNYFIPFQVFEAFVGPLGLIPGTQWHGNFFKCAEDVSHPHWASWSPVPELNFHLPRCFGTINFAP